MNIILLDKDKKSCVARLIHSLIINDEMLFSISDNWVLKGNANDRALVSGIVQKIQKCGCGLIKKQFN